MLTLLATFTFTAAFNIPERFKNDEPNAGMAVLISKAAFKAFVISDSIAMTSSITAAVIVFWSSSRRDAESFMDTLPFANWFDLDLTHSNGDSIRGVTENTMVGHIGLKSLEPHIAKDNLFLFNVRLMRIFVQPKGHSVCVGGYVVVAENANALLHLPAWTFSLCDSASL
ncbi:hypothetical protein Gotri_022165 [Gossypium trilobum]|uniref:PGG domain-containing protein n=1 Tax=Gossypium trilobum TaxID=34281 RepID=A0A7J9DEU2_9ROSI|nr:hypothetical protein [Gossypium trilobum]